MHVLRNDGRLLPGTVFLAGTAHKVDGHMFGTTGVAADILGPTVSIGGIEHRIDGVRVFSQNPVVSRVRGGFGVDADGAQVWSLSIPTSNSIAGIAVADDGTVLLTNEFQPPVVSTRTVDPSTGEINRTVDPGTGLVDRTVEG